MKILVTGINAVQCGHRPKLDYASAVLCVTWALRQKYGEASVEFRPVVVGEDLESYDKIVLYLAPCRGFVGVHTLGSLWAYGTQPDKIVFSFDDWQIREIMVSFQVTLQVWDKTWDKNQFGWRGYDDVKSGALAEFKEIFRNIAQWHFKQPLLVPYYPGGDLSLLHLPGDNVFQFNPAAFFRGKHGELADGAELPKKKQWVLAALHNHQSWLKKQKLQWPVLEFGAKSLGQPRLKESELFSTYAESWGVLSPKYYTCGSGWWRARHGFSADAMAVVAGAPEELSMLGDEYAITPQEVEQLDDACLLELAQAQRARYNYESRDAVVEAVSEALQ